MEAEGEAISFVTSEEENDLHGIEKAREKTIPRITLPDFDYKAPPPPKVRGLPGPRPYGRSRPPGEGRLPLHPGKYWHLQATNRGKDFRHSPRFGPSPVGPATGVSG